MDWIKRSLKNSIAEIMRARDLSLPDHLPFIRNLSEGVALLKQCVQENKQITIVGDYDCDGITSSAILYFGIQEYAQYPVSVIIPDRFREGYGLNMSIVNRIESGLMITVDNGIAAVEQVQKAKEKGLKVLILDHHLIRDDGLVPDADVVVDPHIDDSEFKDYCGAGLAYRFISELNPSSQILRELVALAGLGTVADVMPLVNDNRRLVIEALASVNQKTVFPGVEALLQAARVEEADEETFGFTLGPCFNALGRMEQDGASRMLHLVTDNGDDMDFLLTEARYIVSVNEQRKALVEKEMALAHSMIHDGARVHILNDSTIFTKGTIGLVAGKLTEEYKCPSVVFTANGENLTGSARAPEGVHLKNLLDIAKETAQTQYGITLFVGYGGHAGAAGLTIPAKNYEIFCEILTDLLKDFEPETDVLYYDIEAKPEELREMAEEIAKYAPYGEGNPKPEILCRNIYGGAKEMGKLKNHLCLQAVDVTVMAFHMALKWRQMECPKKLDVIGTLGINTFNNKKYIRLYADDFKAAEEERTEVYKELEGIFSF